MLWVSFVSLVLFPPLGEDFRVENSPPPSHHIHWSFSIQCDYKSVQFSSVQLLSRVWIFVTPWTAACQETPSITYNWSLPKLMSIKSVMAIQSSHPLSSPSPPPPIFPSIRVFLNQSALRIKWSKYWSFSFNISPSNEHLGLIFLRLDWLDLLSAQGTLKSFLQHHSSKASILQCSAFF